MANFEDIWHDQCAATATIKSRYGECAALDYLVGEKLLHFATAARRHPGFAAQLPAFVARVRQMFPRDVMSAYLAELEGRLTEESHEVDMEDIHLESAAISDLISLKQISDFLCAENLGTA